MPTFISLNPGGSEGQPPPSNADSALAALQRAQRLDLHLNSMMLGYLSGSRTILANAIELAEDIYGAESCEMKYTQGLLRHIDKVIGEIDHKIRID